MIRGFLLWLFFASISAAWMFWMNKTEKSVARQLMKVGIISGIVGAVIVAALMLINGISGV